MLLNVLAKSNPWWANAASRIAVHYPKRRIAQGIASARVLDLTTRRALVVVGPRQVGKSVLLKQVADDVLGQGIPPGNLTLVDFSDPMVEASPPTLQQVVDQRPPGVRLDQPRVFLFDEVTHSGDKPPGSGGDWSRALKSLVDQGEQSRHRFIATDSSAAVLRGGTRDSGVGRWNELRLETLSYAEFLALHQLKDETLDQVRSRIPRCVERFLLTGGFPAFAVTTDIATAHEELRSDIDARAIFKDLKRTGLDVERVRSLFVYLMEDSGALFDPRTRRRWLLELGSGDPVDPRSLMAWLEALEETMLVVRLMPFGASPAARLRERAYPKLYAADASLVSAFSISRSPLEDADSRGKVLEAAVFRHLREVLAGGRGECRYLRSKKGEIDFVLTHGRQRVAIEAKATVGRVDPEELRSLSREVGSNRKYIVHLGSHTQKVDDVSLLALEDFLLNPSQIFEEVL